MRDDDLVDARLERGVDDGERLVAAEVAGREDEPVPRDARSTCARLGKELAVVPGHLHRLDPEPELAQLLLEARPLRNLVAGLRLGAAGRLADESTVGSQTMRAPSRAAISTASGFIPPTAWFSDSVPITSTPGRARDDLGALGRRGVVRLEREAREAELGEAPREGDVVDPPRRHVRPDVHVEVVRAADERAGALARRGLLGGHHERDLP